MVQGNLYKFWAPGLEGSNSWVIFLRKTKQNKNVNNHFLVSFFRGYLLLILCPLLNIFLLLVPNKAGTHSIKQFSLTGCEINDLFSGCHQQNLPHFLSMSRYCLFFCIIPVSRTKETVNLLKSGTISAYSSLYPQYVNYVSQKVPQAPLIE